MIPVDRTPTVSGGAPPPCVEGIAFGPVQSRRFGRSLGISNIAPKACPYSCAYCPFGDTPCMCVERRHFHGSDALTRVVRSHLDELGRRGEEVDHLTFVARGEPTLDLGLGPSIRRLHGTGRPVAVMTNGALLDHPEVREALSAADRVSIKVDAARPDAWDRVCRPHRRLDLVQIQEGMRAFARSFRGVLVTETVLVEGLNDDEDELRATADFVAALGPSTAYVTVPLRRSPDARVRPAPVGSLVRAWELLQERVPRAELLVGHPGGAAPTGGFVTDLLALAAVRPLGRAAVGTLLRRAHLQWSVVDRLVEEGRLAMVGRGPRRWYLRPPAAP